jgi:Ca-activated chloride channel family protein
MMSILRKINSKFTFILVISAVALVLGACSTPAEKLNQDGNDAFAEQAFLEALDLYQSAQVESPELAEPYFNAANALYRQGDYPAALEQMQMALQYVDQGNLAESSYYNLGNTLFNSQELDTAVEAYKQALLLNPDDQDAKYNLELALQQQEQQQQQQEQQQEQNQEQNEESQDQSQEGEGEDQESDQDENQDPQDSENQGENNEDQEGDQSQNNDQQDGDQQDEQENSSGEPQEGENQPDGEQPSQVPPPGQRMTEEQARQLLAALADDMETLQEKLGQYLFARQSPPAQDW